MIYVPESPPVDPKDIPEYLERELRRISTAFSQVHDHEELHAEPPKLHEGMVRYADGSDWNPGSGEGLYVRLSDRWISMSGGSFLLDVAKGNISGHSAVNKFGKSTNVDRDTDTDIHDGANSTDNVDIWVAPTQARTHQIVSTSASDDGSPAGVGANTVRVYGLTSWVTAEVSEDITLNGTTNVPTVNQYVIIHRIKVLTKGATNVNVGVITATADTDGTVTAQIGAGVGQTLMAIYGVPSTQTAYMAQYYVSAIKAAASLSAACTLLVNPGPDSEVTQFLTKNTNGITTEGSNHMSHLFTPYYKIPGPAIIKIQANSSSNNTIISAGFDLILVDN